VRQAALDRLPRRWRENGARRRRKPAAASVIEPDVVILSGVEHHLLVGALRNLPERVRSALWLTEVERMTPAEASAVLGLEPSRVTAVSAQARDHVLDVCLEAHRRSVFRPGCQHCVERLGAYVRGQLIPRERVMIKAHLDRCLPCRMRRSELTDVAGSLIGALPPLPLLGGECQRHWLAFASAGPRPARVRSRATAGPRRVPAQVAVAAAMLAFIFGLTAVVTPRPSSPRTAVAAPAAAEVSDLPPPWRPSETHVLLASAATAAPAPASVAAQSPARPQLPAAGTFVATAKWPVDKLEVTPAAAPAPPAPAANPPDPPTPVPTPPAGVVPQGATPPAPAPALPAPKDKSQGKGKSGGKGRAKDGDKAKDRETDRDRDKDRKKAKERDRDRHKAKDRDGDRDGHDKNNDDSSFQVAQGRRGDRA
jgi:hypothetical protein